MTNNVVGIPTPAEVEADAPLTAVQWLRQEGFTSIHIETDCKQMIDSIRSDSFPNNEYGSIVYKCKEELNDVPSSRISFIRRQAKSSYSLLSKSILFLCQL